MAVLLCFIYTAHLFCVLRARWRLHARSTILLTSTQYIYIYIDVALSAIVDLYKCKMCYIARKCDYANKGQPYLSDHIVTLHMSILKPFTYVLDLVIVKGNFDLIASINNACFNWQRTVLCSYSIGKHNTLFTHTYYYLNICTKLQGSKLLQNQSSIRKKDNTHI